MRNFKLFLFLLMSGLLAACQQQPSNMKKIGIIIPIEVKAMDEIVKGFEASLQAKSPVPLAFTVENSQGDINMERAIIAQMQAQNYDIVAPIGTDATEMTLAMLHDRPIVSLAASYSQQQRKQLRKCQVAVVHDEIPVAKSIAFLHEAYPQLKNIVLIHSASDKIFPEVQDAILAGKQYGITVKDMMAPTLNDIYSVANNIPANTQAIFVLKDSLIVSGITTLEIAAAKNHIPLYTSDQGSVQDGAAFALGVHEREIGEEGGKLAAEILQGKPACSLPIVEMQNLTVFINPTALAKAGQSLAPIAQAAAQQHYKIELVTVQGAN